MYIYCMYYVKVGSREDSSVYIRMKIRAASEVGIKVSHIQLPDKVSFNPKLLTG